MPVSELHPEVLAAFKRKYPHAKPEGELFEVFTAGFKSGYHFLEADVILTKQQVFIAIDEKKYPLDWLKAFFYKGVFNSVLKTVDYSQIKTSRLLGCCPQLISQYLKTDLSISDRRLIFRKPKGIAA